MIGLWQIHEISCAFDGIIPSRSHFDLLQPIRRVLQIVEKGDMIVAMAVVNCFISRPPSIFKMIIHGL
jgi:hypothetical protein